MILATEFLPLCSLPALSSKVYQTSNDPRFVAAGRPRRIWAVSAVHGEVQRLMDMHDVLYKEIQPGDRIIYLGNYIGGGACAVETVDELLAFRRSVLAIPGMMADDLVYLRGGQEEMWEKLLQIQFAPNPAKVLQWMLDKGLHSTLVSYGVNPQDGLTATQEGVRSLTKWTSRVRAAIRRHAGHEIFSAHWKRAAYTEQHEDNAPLLFVHAGIDPDLPLQKQGDSFWWAGQNFNNITLPYAPFTKVVRGYDPGHGGVHINCVTATIDGGCGFGGNLVCAGFAPNGELFELFET